MISNRHRFHGYNSLRVVYREGTTTRGPQFALKTRLNPKRRSYRAAVVVPRKVNKSAVARNRIRRRLYEALREMQTEITEPHDIIINVFQDEIQSEPYVQLRGQLKKQLKDAGVIKRRHTP